jgi:hypothetical protein
VKKASRIEKTNAAILRRRGIRACSHDLAFAMMAARSDARATKAGQD